MKIDYSHEKNTLQDEITKTNNNHQKTTQEMDSDFNEKLIFEYEKYEVIFKFSIFINKYVTYS